MLLSTLFAHHALTPDAANLEISRVESDSRLCSPGTLFFALPGATSNGLDHVADAVARGARAVVAPVEVATSVPVITVATTSLLSELARCCSAITGQPQQRARLVGVTGTNGKTSVVTLVAQLAHQLGWPAASMGTLTQERTTPPSPELFRNLDVATRDWSDPTHAVVAMEVSSHAIDQRRIEGLRYEVAAFTNLSHDHLDYHGDMDHYFAAKAALFTPEHARRAVVWVDDPWGARLAELTTLPVVAVGRDHAADTTMTLSGTHFEWRGHHVSSPFLGRYNVDNTLMALTILVELGALTSEVADAMSRVTGVPGRFEIVHQHPTVIVDYAHTPEGLDRLLRDVREIAGAGRIITVFGCGGDRDRQKRPAMGAVGATLSDISFVTSDNPRSEAPDAIIEEVLSGVPDGYDVRTEVDRRQAIAQALAVAQSHDVVVVAGKGHETTQTIGTTKYPFDDRLVVKELMEI